MTDQTDRLAALGALVKEEVRLLRLDRDAPDDRMCNPRYYDVRIERLSDVAAETRALADALGRMREALRFYADEWTWGCSRQDWHLHGEQKCGRPIEEDDYGQRARDALAALDQAEARP